MKEKRKGLFKRFIAYYKPHRKLLIIDLISASLIAAIDLLFPMFTRKILNDFIPNGKYNFIIYAGLLLLFFFIIRIFLNFVLNYWGHIMGTRMERDMRKDLFHKLEVSDYQFFDEHKTGVLMSYLTNHLRDLAEMAHHVPEDFLISVLLIAGSFIFLMFINVPLTLIVFSIFTLVLIFSFSRRRKMLKSFRTVRAHHGELNAQIESSLSGVRLTKAYNNEEHEIKKFQKVNKSYEQSWKKAYFQLGIFHSGNRFLIELNNLALLMFGALFTIKGIINHADLLTYFLYINFLINPINRILNMMETVQQGISGFEKFHAIMLMEPQIKNKENAIILDIPKGDIEFKKVSFQYEDEMVLENLDLKIKPGTTVALIGETGVGKTTISKLIPRFYDVQEGEVLIDNINIKDYDLYSLRRAIGHVQQDVFIFYGSIKDNILYGNPGASDEEVILAAKQANIHEFILTLPDGYDSLVGEKGLKLSGGQKQRISIARLFLKNPSILILDEATSSLDNITEALIQEALDELAENKTTLVIAHRLSTIKNADEIIVLGKDGVLERGKHEELLESGGYYSTLYNAGATI